MRNKNSTIFNVFGVIGMVIGVLTVIILIGIPIIICASKHLAWAKMSDDEVAKDRDTILIWGIIMSVLIFPIGLLALIPAFNLDGQISSALNISGSAQTKEKDFASKLERIKKLHELKEQGILDEEDFKLAKEKILNEEEK